MFFGLLGGLALFIYGMTEMGKGLQLVAGSKMKKILESLTSVPILGVIVGTVVTAIIQSSSATTVMVVGFTNAGLMTLKQAVSVIMGSNIGTTVTGQLVSFDLAGMYMPMIGIGFLLMFIIKKPMIKNIGKIVFAFGVLFLGMSLMSEAMAPLEDSETFKNFIQTFGKYRILALLAGMLLTMLIQSSSAAIGILIAMTGQGLVTLDIALPVLLGFNIGTCITAILASIGTKVTARRAALAHVTFNVIGAIIFLIGLPLFESATLAISPAEDVARQVANAHTLFNVVNTIILLPFINQLVKFVTKILPGEDLSLQQGAIYLDKRVLNDSNLALNLAMREIIRMGQLSRENITNAVEYFKTRDPQKSQEVLEVEDVVDELEKQITDYLVKIKSSGLSDKMAKFKGDLFHVVNDLERMSDHAVNIQELGAIAASENLHFSEKAMAEIDEMYHILIENIAKSISALEHKDKSLLDKIYEDEDVIDYLEEKYRNEHIARLNSGECTASTGVVFLDVLSNFERVGDHCNNIAHIVNKNFV